MLRKNELSKRDKKSALEHKRLIGEILKLLAERFGGETTLNQMRIGHYAGLKSLYERVPTNNTDMSKTLGIPRSTVSRIVNDCIDKGWLLERPDLEDGRKRLVVVPADHPEADGFEIAFRALMVEFLTLYDEGEITKVDCDGNGF